MAKSWKELIQYGNTILKDEMVDRDGNIIMIIIVYYPEVETNYYYKIVNGKVVEVKDLL